MDKLEFIEKAPSYYAVAIAIRLQVTEGHVFSREDVQAYFSDESFSVFLHEPIWSRAIALLATEDYFELIQYDFGPTLIFAKEGRPDWIETIAA